RFLVSLGMTQLSSEVGNKESLWEQIPEEPLGIGNRKGLPIPNYTSAPQTHRQNRFLATSQNLVYYLGRSDKLN
ncbi:MAG: hypothetical protein ACPGWR_15055, partial [Ardenticatenaceae bacterium]